MAWWLAAAISVPLWLPPVPGALNPAVTQQTIHQTICVPGWSTSVRPPQAVTEAEKRKVVRRLPDPKLSHYQWDHLIGIDLGGAVNDPLNVWAQPLAGTCNAYVKDDLDRLLPRLVCAGQVSLRDAQQEIATNWVASYNRRIGPLRCE